MGVIDDSIQVYKEMVKARTQDCINYKQQIDQLTNNWNELEEWLIELKTPKTNYWGDTGFTYMLKIDVILDKMKEIKENNDEVNK